MTFKNILNNLNLDEYLEAFKENMELNINVICYKLEHPNIYSDSSKTINWFFNNWLEQFDWYIDGIRTRIKQE